MLVLLSLLSFFSRLGSWFCTPCGVAVACKYSQQRGSSAPTGVALFLRSRSCTWLPNKGEISTKTPHRISCSCFLFLLLGSMLSRRPITLGLASREVEKKEQEKREAGDERRQGAERHGVVGRLFKSPSPAAGRSHGPRRDYVLTSSGGGPHPAHHCRWLHMPSSASERNLYVITTTHRAYVRAPLRQ
jgi:hypothetical protein